MRVFLTGASGFIGSAVIPELIKAGHQVLGMVRSDEGAKAVLAAGAEAHRGDIYDLDSIRAGVSPADAVIHTAFNHDFSKYVENCETDRRVIEAMGSVLAGSGRPLIVTSGTGMARAQPGTLSTEDQTALSSSTMPRAASEEAALAVAEQGVRVSIVRLPQVHDTRRQGLVTYAIATARDKGVFTYVGDGSNRWPAAHVSDVARLYALAVEKGEAGARYHAVAEEGVAIRDIAEVIGRGMKIPVVSVTPEEAKDHLGWLATFASLDLPASGKQTQEKLAWHPVGPTLLTDLEHMDFAA